MTKIEAAKKKIADASRELCEAVSDKFHSEVKVTGISIKVVNHYMVREGTYIMDTALVTSVTVDTVVNI